MEEATAGRGLTRRGFGAGGASLAAVGGSLISFPRSARAGTVPINMQIGGIISGQQLGEVVAKQLGFFADEGLDFQIQPGGPNNDGVAIVASGRYEVGQVASSPSLMLAVSQGIPIRCFGIGGQQHTYAYFSLAKNPVRTPADLRGKTVGTQGTGQILLRAMLAKNNIDPKDVKIFIMSWDMIPILTGQVDVVTASLANVSQLKPLGDDRVAMRLWDTGVRLYPNPYYATIDALTAKRDLLLKFLRAAGKGWEYAYNNPEKSVALMVKEFPAMIEADELAASRAIRPYTFDANTRENGWATMDPAIWQEQISLWSQLGQFTKEKPTVDQVMTLDLLNATKDSRPRIG
jgi:NitT/TauT family transport system substrate-binding protein